MRAVLRRSGGFAGVSRRWEVAPPPAAEAERRLRAAVAAAAFFALPPELRADRQAPDAFTWTLEIEDAGQRHAVRFEEAAASEALLALIEAVQDLSEGAPGA